MIERDLLELYESTCSVQGITGRRRDGKPTLGPAQSERCHVEVQTRKVLNASGDEVTSSGRVHLTGPREDITDEWVLTLPNGTKPRIVALETTHGQNLDTGENGPYQTLIYYGG